MPIMLSDVMLNAVMLSVVAPEIGVANKKSE
jgi:hypothetical protein